MSYKDQKNNIVSFLISSLSFVPIFVFMFYARLKGLERCNAAWAEPFYTGALLALMAIAIQWYAGLTLDRLMLGANLFLIIAACLFFFNANPCLYFLGAYDGAFFIVCVLLAGILTTFTTPSGFIGVSHANKNVIRSNSLRLLGLTGGAFVWALIANSYGLFISAIIPFIGLRIIAGKLQRTIKNT